MGPVQLNIYVGQKHLEHNYVIWKAYFPSFENLLRRSRSSEVFLYNVTVHWLQSLHTSKCIDYFPIAHNTLCLPPKFCITYCLKMLLGKCNTPRSI